MKPSETKTAQEYIDRAKKAAKESSSGWPCTLTTLLDKLEKENAELRKKLEETNEASNKNPDL